MTPIDSLKVGHWVAVVRDKTIPEGLPPEVKISYSGQPVNIVAVSLPFLAVFDGEKIDAIDVREYEVQRVSNRYVKAMLMKPPESSQDGPEGKTDPNACPRCGERLVQRLTQRKESQGEWRAFCANCKLDAGPVQEG